MGQPIVQVDSFTDKQFSGNPAAVCILPSARDERWMQNVASEMNLSETAFLVKRNDGYDLRWFTPAVEVDLCGHATLASSHMLWEEGHLQPTDVACFHTRSGLLTAKRNGTWIELDFPATPPQPVLAPPELLRALNVKPAYIGKSRFDYLIEVESEEIVRNMKPDFTALKSITTRGIIVTSKSSKTEFDFVSRFFAPSAGIDEDPATGSAHCALGPYWQSKMGKSEFMAYQASARGGVVKVRCNNDRVLLGGKAVTVLRGELIE